MNKSGASCGFRKNILFILQSSAFNGDRNYQVARMALAIAMDASPNVLLSGKALALAALGRKAEKPLADFYEQERHLHDLGIPCYVVREELSTLGLTEEGVRPGITTISVAECNALLKRMNFIVTA